MDFAFFALGIFAFILGLCIGSFLNCVIYRLALPNFSFHKNLGGRGRSFCPNCKHQLSWQDLIPVLSFLFLRGKCRYCGEKISFQYPLVELAAGIIFLLLALLSSNASSSDYLNLFFLFYIASSLIVIFVYDLKHYLIPDKVLFPAILITFLYRLFENLFIENWILISNEPYGESLMAQTKFQISNFALLGGYFLAVALGAGFFLLIFLVSRGRWMGFGDVKLAVLMGLLLGFPDILAGLFLAFLFGAVVGLILMILKKKNLKSQMPFAPFLIAGTFAALFWGQEIINWYLIFSNINSPNSIF